MGTRAGPARPFPFPPYVSERERDAIDEAQTLTLKTNARSSLKSS